MRVLTGPQHGLQWPLRPCTPRIGAPAILRRNVQQTHVVRRQTQRTSRYTVVVNASTLFEGLNKSLTKAWDAVRKDGKLTAENIKEPMKMIRRALLEADVRAVWGQACMHRHTQRVHR